MQSRKIRIGISSCLLGEEVRYDGDHKRNAIICETLGNRFELVPFCPEVGIGLGVPRATISLVDKEGSLRAIQSTDPLNDVTQRLVNYADQQQVNQKHLSGYILKSRSPSCGLEQVPVYQEGSVVKRGTGIYAQKLRDNFPLLPVEEEEQLGDSQCRDSFIRRVCVYARWQQMNEQPVSLDRLQQFHAQHESIVSDHDPAGVNALENLLIGVKHSGVAAIADDYIACLMEILKKPATCSNPRAHR